MPATSDKFTARLTSSAGARPARVRTSNAQAVAKVLQTPVKLQSDHVAALQERRRRRRVRVQPMYTSVTVRVLSQRGSVIEGHVLDLCENGIAVEIDSQIPLGQSVTVEFRISGLGRLVGDTWAEFAAAAEVVRHDDADDFPQGPYKMALRFVRISTMAQAQIARYVAMQPG